MYLLHETKATYPINIYYYIIMCANKAYHCSKTAALSSQTFFCKSKEGL